MPRLVFRRYPGLLISFLAVVDPPSASNVFRMKVMRKLAAKKKEAIQRFNLLP